MTNPDSPEAVAIIGMAGRFPQARNLAEFWQNLRAGREAVSFFRDDEVQWLPIEHPPRLDDPSFVKARAVLERPEWFDAAFFGMNPREAALMDPQHRVFLECAWEALENAGLNPDTFPGLIGVFAGASMNSYLFTNLLTNRGLVENHGFFPTLIANDNDFVPTRVSYKLNLRGPSINVQTACSTSLVAVCLAVQNLLSYRCDVALAGGVSITFPARRGQYHLPGGILSNDGHCRAFSADASGTVLGDGAGIVVLKRLSEALADGDHVCAVIRGTAINNDGSAKIGYTAPNSDGQAEVIAMAQAEAGFSPGTVSYVEAHGTGTPLGDPIEVEGLKKAFGLKSERGQFCGIGSVKTNIGHLDITAGVAGLIKTVLALESRELPPSLHFSSPNPKINFAQSPFYVVDSLRPWPEGRTPRRAGVSSFGIGGTNAHVAVEEAPPMPASSPATPRQLLVASARSAPALESAVLNLADHLDSHPALNLADVAATLQTGRRAFAYRHFVVADDCAEAARRLREPTRAPLRAATDTSPPVAFLFPGQGVQHVNMAVGLYEAEPVFRGCVDECCRILAPRLGLDLRSLLFPAAAHHETAATRLNETSITQPALFVIEYALARLWQHRGIKPAMLAGHSLGEYVAACLAGVFSLDDALLLVALRAGLMQAQPRGAMLAVRLPETEAAALAKDGLALAAINAPELCVLAGPTGTIADLEQALSARGIGAKKLTTSHAFHSPMMEPVLAPFVTALESIRLQAPQLPCLSNLTGTWLTAEQATDPAYWAAHLRSTVRFADNVRTLLGEGSPVLLEVGPGQALSSLVRLHAAALGHAAPVSSLGRPTDKQDDLRTFTEASGLLWAAGVNMDWKTWHEGARRHRVPLPTYPFERQRYWIEPGEYGIRKNNKPISNSGNPAEPAEQPTLSADAVPSSSQPSKPPSLRDRLAALFRDLAGHDFSGANAVRSFHELGLDSLLLTQVSFALREQFGADVTMRQLIESYPSLDRLAAHLENVASPVTPSTATTSVVTTPVADELVPLTQAQQEIWYASQMGPVLSAAYNESFVLHLHGQLDEACLRDALSSLVERHESLRSTFPPDGGQQRIAVSATPDFALVDISTLPADEQATRLKAELESTIRQTFDLVNGPLWRSRAIRTAPDQHAVVFVVHHIICDGWSQGVIAHELAELYSARRAGRAPELLRPVRFGDYARQEARRLEQPDPTAGDYWAGRFSDGVPVLELPSDRPRPAVRTFAAAHQHRRLQPATVAAVRQLAAQTECTHFTVLLSGFAVLLHRLSGQDDLVIGVPASPQVLAGLKTLVGHCVNLLPIRSRLGENQTVASFLQTTRGVTLDGFEHWQHPFASLLRRLNLSRNTNRVPLTNVTFNVSRHGTVPTFDGLTVEAATNPKGFVNFDINFNVTETDRHWVVDCNYSTELFDADTIERALDRYELILCAAAADTQRPVHRLPFVTATERRKIMVEWNDTDKDYPRHECLHELFEAQAARTPDATAIVAGTRRWTYRQLDEHANRLAHRLRRLGVKSETSVGIHAARRPETIAALFAILKAGGAYIPLDPAYPEDRVRYMLEDSRASVLITDRARVGAAPAFGDAGIIDLGDDEEAILRESVTKPVSRQQPGNLAYVIYTSGSTGRPKGVAIEHRNGVSLAYWGRDTFSREELAGMFAGTSLSFDLSVFEIFVTLAWGGTIHLAENALALANLPSRQEITFINSVPSVVAELLRLGIIPSSVQTIFLAGEALPDSLAERLLALPHLKKLYEGYGPSEDTTFSSYGLRRPGVRSNLGRPFPNTRFYLLDRNLELVPPGVVGEICIAGEGLARGYLNQPGLTQQKFIRNPHSNAPAARLYRTGDLARQRPDNGLLEFAGRLDHQVKIRGFRVELGEIEAVLGRHPEVRQCAITIHEPSPGDKRIVAYFTSATEPGPELAQLRSHIARELPEYMVPAAFISLKQFAFTPTGKIDRKALPAPEFSNPVEPATDDAPRTVTEEILAGIWCDVLRLPRAGIHDNFFELGGHSLLVTQVLARVQQAFEIELPLRLAFEAPTIAGLSVHIEHALAAEIDGSTPEPESASAAIA